MTISQRIKIIREKKKLTQDQFASKLGVSRFKVYDYESGRSLPGIEILEKLHMTFSINLNWLIANTGKMYLNDYETSPSEVKVLEEIRDRYNRVLESAYLLGEENKELKDKLNKKK